MRGRLLRLADARPRPLVELQGLIDDNALADLAVFGPATDCRQLRKAALSAKAIVLAEVFGRFLAAQKLHRHSVTLQLG